jgi:hypothetical protein
MKHSSLLAASIAFSLIACGPKPAETPAAQMPAATPLASFPSGHPVVDAAKIAQAAPQPPLTQKARVLNAINATQYTYLEVMQDNKTRWLAATSSPAIKGDAIQFDDGTTMSNFNSKVLNRTFSSITFVGRVVVSNGKA